MAPRKKASFGRDRNTLDQATLRTLLHYDPDTGIFTRLTTGYAQTDARYAGKRVGYVNSNGYVAIAIFSRPYRAHQLAFLYMTGVWPKVDIDHINRDRVDNRWVNLREASRTQNLFNTGLRVDNQSGVRGVSWSPARQKWVAQIKVGATSRRKRFDTKEAAIVAYQAWSRELVGDFLEAA